MAPIRKMIFPKRLESRIQKPPKGYGASVFLVHLALGASSFPRELDMLPALAYCNPLGFWSVFNAGFFRLDVSVGNILVVKRPFDSKQAFDVEALISQYGDDRTDT